MLPRFTRKEKHSMQEWLNDPAKVLGTFSILLAGTLFGMLFAVFMWGGK